MHDFGASDDRGRLSVALVRSPERELDAITQKNLDQMLWLEEPNADTARQQHQELTRLLTENGVMVIRIEGDKEYPNLSFCRDQFITLPNGHLLAHFKHSCRKGEEAIAEDALRSIGVTPWRSVACSGPYEGGDFLLADDRIMLAGYGKRTHLKSIDELRDTLYRGGVTSVVPIPVPDVLLHLDCGMLPIGGRKIISALTLPASTRDLLEQKFGFRIISIPIAGVGENFLGLNVLFLNPKLALVSKSAPDPLVRLLHDGGIHPLLIDVSEFEKGAGGVHCLVGTISRLP